MKPTHPLIPGLLTLLALFLFIAAAGSTSISAYLGAIAMGACLLFIARQLSK